MRLCMKLRAIILVFVEIAYINLKKVKNKLGLNTTLVMLKDFETRCRATPRRVVVLVYIYLFIRTIIMSFGVHYQRIITTNLIMI